MALKFLANKLISRQFINVQGSQIAEEALRAMAIIKSIQLFSWEPGYYSPNRFEGIISNEPMSKHDSSRENAIDVLNEHAEIITIAAEINKTEEIIERIFQAASRIDLSPRNLLPSKRKKAWLCPVLSPSLARRR